MYRRAPPAGGQRSRSRRREASAWPAGWLRTRRVAATALCPSSSSADAATSANAKRPFSCCPPEASLLCASRGRPSLWWRGWRWPPAMLPANADAHQPAPAAAASAGAVRPPGCPPLRPPPGPRSYLDRLVVNAGALDASKCLASGDGIVSAVLGQEAHFTITPCDGRGYAKRMARGTPFRISVLNAGSGLSGSRRLTFGVDPQPDGSYDVRYNAFGPPGDFLLQVTFAGKPIQGSPFRVAVGAPAVPSAAPSPATAAMQAHAAWTGDAGTWSASCRAAPPSGAPGHARTSGAGAQGAAGGRCGSRGRHAPGRAGMAEGERAVLLALGAHRARLGSAQRGQRAAGAAAISLCGYSR